MSKEAKIAWLRATSKRLMEIAEELNAMGYYNFSDEIDEERFEIHKEIRGLENEEILSQQNTVREYTFGDSPGDGG